MFLFFFRTKDNPEALIARIKMLDEMPHSDIYSRWEADRQILILTRQLKELNQ